MSHQCIIQIAKKKKKVFVGFAHWGNFTTEHSSPLPPLPQAALQDSQQDSISFKWYILGHNILSLFYFHMSNTYYSY